MQNDFSKIVAENQRRLASDFDYIVCGAGTSCCVVAARLAADPAISVLLLEAGGGDDTDLIGDPHRWPITLGSELDWQFVAGPNPRLNGRAIQYPMGKVLGGGSSINVATWSRGHRADWDFHASKAGDAAWSYAARSTSTVDVSRPGPGILTWIDRGIDGTVHVQPAADPHPFALSLLEGAKSLGLERFPDPNGRMMEAASGCALVDETVRHGRRQSIFRSYVYPLMDRRNLTALTGALVTRILFDDHRATGIELHWQGKSVRVHAEREVVLSLGAIHTPKLLMQSGIGDYAELKRMSIPVLQDLPSVGRNLHDHVAFGCVWESTR